MTTYNDAITKLFSEKEKLVIIGLTGRTGSGCSTAANILSKEYNQLDLQYGKSIGSLPAHQYKFEIIKEYISSDNRWLPFTKIEGSCVILSYIFSEKSSTENCCDALIGFLTKLQKATNGISFQIDNFDDLVKEIQGLEYIFKAVQKLPLENLNINEPNDIEPYYNLYIKNFPEYKARFKKILSRYSCYEEKKKKIQDEPPVKYHLYTYLLQKIGNNIRASGKPYENTFSQDKIFSFAERLDLLINLIIQYDNKKKNGKSRICIDAIRNPIESNYIKDRYRHYHLISISVDEDTRKKRLKNLDIDELNSLDNVEYNSKLDSSEFFYHQNIANCFEMADIHLVNTQETGAKNFSLTWQLVKYVTLMLHPGLVTPSAIERCMQLAYNVKYNSGCLSRQVGAVVTGSDFAIKAVGWNEVPSGQLSCSLRNINSYCIGNMKTCYSQFEYEDSQFEEVMNYINTSIHQSQMHGRKFPYCFKDIYNGCKGERNQVYTRALHAEENAFLQISKYGGQGVKDGYLFCTASPCELCAKKAYQLGIRNIYYIDPYPGISEKHVLHFGERNCSPKMTLFHGAIGESYIQLYKPLLPYKDELELVSGINCKEEIKKKMIGENASPKTKDLLYHKIEFSIEFKNRENIESLRKVDIEVKNGTYDKLDRQLTWTGSSYDKSELINNNENYTLVDSKDKISPYHYQIQLNKAVALSEHIKYEIKSYVKDETHLMHEYFAQMIKYPTKQLILRVIIPEANPLLENIRYVRYADLSMECEHTDKCKINTTTKNGKTIYTLKINNPNLFYTYSLEWDFMNVKS